MSASDPKEFFIIERERAQTLVREVLQSRLPVYAAILRRQFAAVAEAPERISADERAWTAIDSLSKLRAEVGGRFQNLRERWLQSGFPLREHRGDQPDRWKVDFDGWSELSSWIFKQGFESRLSDGEEGSPMFEVRKLERDSS